MDTKLLRFFSNPSSYDHDPGSVEHLQTHISHVFMAGDYVYKVKKPVNFDFLDFSTLENRRHYCRREVELNRRLCDDIYLGVVPVRAQGSSFEIGKPGDDEHGMVVEYAVKMKKLSEEHFLHAYMDREELGPEHLDRIAGKLAQFYGEQDPDAGDKIKEWGAIEKIRVNTDENFRQTRVYVGDTLDETAYRAIREYTSDYFSRFEALFESRIRNNCIVDGHGDLHLEHIHITPEKVRIYDCIEFNDRFRYGDTAADLAFLAMDLDFNRCRKEERYFMKRMAQLLDDDVLLHHLDFYKCYRAYVKGKVKSLQSSEEEVGEENRDKARRRAREYFDLSLRYATLGSQATVLVVMGRVATGKSTIAEALSNRLNLDHYASDRIRKQLVGVPLDERTEASRREEVYSEQVSAETYEQLTKKAEEHVGKRESVILDATYSRKEDRQKLIGRLEDMGADYCFMEAKTDNQSIRRRLKKREDSDGVISDARLEDFDAINAYYEPPVEIDRAHCISLNTTKSPEETLSACYTQLTGRTLDKVADDLDGSCMMHE